MDGNGRWARRRRLPRVEGHRAGVKSAQAAVEVCRDRSLPVADGTQVELHTQVLRMNLRMDLDRENGEWFWRVRADGTVDPGMPKVSEWKCPYHTTRMCLEMMRRLDRGAGVTP